MFRKLKRFIGDNFPAIRTAYRGIKQLLITDSMRLKIFERRSMKSLPEIEHDVSRTYREIFGRPLNWENPQSYTEKLNVSKVYMPTPEKTRLADKYSVREWVACKIGSEHLVPLLGVYDSFDAIDFDSLPSQFVMKCNHDSGSVTVVKDKSSLNISRLRKLYDFYMKRNFAWASYELHYKDIKPRIIIEQYMSYIESAGTDYKFFCFDGKPYYCRILINHRINFYDMDWKLQPFTWGSYGLYDGDVPCPKHFDRMKELAAELSQGFDHVRVDFYLVGDDIYFGEMTFTSMAGTDVITPDEWDFKLGSLWNFDNGIRAGVLGRQS